MNGKDLVKGKWHVVMFNAKREYIEKDIEVGEGLRSDIVEYALQVRSKEYIELAYMYNEEKNILLLGKGENEVFYYDGLDIRHKKVEESDDLGYLEYVFYLDEIARNKIFKIKNLNSEVEIDVKQNILKAGDYIATFIEDKEGKKEKYEVEITLKNDITFRELCEEQKGLYYVKNVENGKIYVEAENYNVEFVDDEENEEVAYIDADDGDDVEYLIEQAYSQKYNDNVEDIGKYKIKSIHIDIYKDLEVEISEEMRTRKNKEKEVGAFEKEYAKELNEYKKVKEAFRNIDKIDDPTFIPIDNFNE